MLGERSKDYFHHGYNCGEAVLRVFKNHYDFMKAVPVSTGLGFGGGCGSTGNMCGAILSATVVLSIAAFGDKENIPKEEKNAFYGRLQILFGKVEKLYGSTQCRDLKKTPEDGRTVCSQLVEDVIGLTREELERGFVHGA